jgi:C-terminal processing protease CtpA/Prc
MNRRFACILTVIGSIFALVGCAVSTTTTTTTGAVEPTSTTNTTTVTTTTTTPTTTTTTTTTTEAMEPGHYRLSELQADFDQFVRYLSINPKIFTDPEEYATVVAEQRELLRHGMTQLEFYRILTVVAAAIRCGHTFVFVPQAAMQAIFDAPLAYPVDVRLMDDELVVVGIDGETGLAFGDVIVSIDGKSASEVVADMKRFLGADGEGTTYKNRVFSLYFFAYYQLYLGTTETIEVEYFDQTTEALQTETLSRNCPNTHGWVEQPLFETSFEEDRAVLTLRSFYPEGTVTLNDFYDCFAQFFQTVENLGIRKVILDVRGNGGGDPRVASRLLSYLTPSAVPYFSARSDNYYPGLKSPVPLSEPHYDGTLVTLVDAFCFSTCGHFTALLKYHRIGILIGEETNGGFVCTDSSMTLTLTWTQMRFNMSTIVWEVAVEGMTLGRGNIPDIESQMTLLDYRDGIDRVYQTALDWLEARE